MSNTEILCRIIIMWTVAIGTYSQVQAVESAQPEGWDFTIPADARYVPGELLVRFASKANGAQRNTAERRQILNVLGGAKIVRQFRIVPGLTLVELPTGQTVRDALKIYNNESRIVHARPNYLLEPASTFPNDPDLDQQWGHHNTGQNIGGWWSGTEDADVDAPEAWDIATDATDIVVAVIDSGIDYTHPDLAANMWINPGEDHPPLGIVGPEDFDGINDDGNTDGEGNPLIDDLYGYDFSTFGGKVRDSDPFDDHGHGTHVSGIMGARGNDGVGGVGVCWNVKMMAVKIISQGFLLGEGWVWRIETADAIDAIDYAVSMGADILNSSWGGDIFDPDLRDAIGNAENNAKMFVACAHNDGRDIDEVAKYPASYSLDNIISVMATDGDDVRSEWPWLDDPGSSNWGADSVDIAAPGTDVFSCVPGNAYDYYSGTSMATPYVSGACALVWAASPDLSLYEVKQIVLGSVDVLPQLENDPVLGRLCATGGRLNLHQALLDATREPAHWWKLDDGSGLEAFDSSGRRHGTLCPGFPIDDSQWIGGRVDGALSFDGIDDYVEIGPLNALSTSEVKISAWIYPSAVNVDHAPILGQYYREEIAGMPGQYDYFGYDFCLLNNRVAFYVGNTEALSTMTVNANEWYYVTGVYDGEVIEVYINGQLADREAFQGAAGVVSTAYIGHSFSDATDPSSRHYFSGVIDDVRIYGDCMPECHADYSEWVSVGKPNCWCFESQCYGDADGQIEGGGKIPLCAVSTNDLNILMAAWQIPEPPEGPGIEDVRGPNGELGICADFDHATQGGGKVPVYRVGSNDLNILVASWQVPEPPDGPGIPTDCLSCAGGGAMAMNGGFEASTLDAIAGATDFAAITAWLEEVWLDAAVLEKVDEDQLMRLTESIAELLEE